MKRPDPRLLEMIDEATADAHDEYEQHMGFEVMLDEHVRCPFTAHVVGEEVEVVRFGWDGHPSEIVARCRRGGREYRVNITALEWRDPPHGAEWIEAYRKWLRLE